MLFLIQENQTRVLPCLQCFLGGNYVAKVKAKLPAKTDGDVVSVAPGIFSVRYHQDFRFIN